MTIRSFFLSVSLFACVLPSNALRAAPAAAPAAKDIDAATRLQVAATLTRIVGREVAGATVAVDGVKSSRKEVTFYTSIGMSYYPFREQNVRAIYDSVRLALPDGFRKAAIRIITDKHEIADLIPMAYRDRAAVREAVRRKKIVPFRNPSARPLVTPLSRALPSQGLSGRHIALWQSHGRYFDQAQNRWKWQRSRLWQTCEDLYTQSYVLPFLVPMLENAGANVLLPRERDVQIHEVLCDNDVASQYHEQGSWETLGVGFAHLKQTYHTYENPFRHGTARSARTISAPLPAESPADNPAAIYDESPALLSGECRAVWNAAIPERGQYAVYVSYRSSRDSADDAFYTVRHLGGESRFLVNQTMGGGTWIYLGTFLLAEGSQDIVTLSNRSRQTGRTVSADAVKIGGGYGNVARTPCDSLRKPGVEYVEEISGYPRFCEGARYWLQWAGFDESVYTPKQNKDDYRDDYMSRALWVNTLMGGSPRFSDSVGLHIPIDMALAFHSDAGVRDGDETIGTLGIFYTKDNDGRFEGGADRYRSRDLTDIVMTQIMSDIRQTYEPLWNRRGMWNRSYYEARVPVAPTMLLESLSHQNFADMRLGSDPRFRFLVSRAVYKGILRFIASQYDTECVVQPLAVESFSAGFEGQDQVKLQWTPVLDALEPTAVPTGYRVYTRLGDGDFDHGRYTTSPTLTVSQEPGVIYSYRVTAVNDGGESFPSETLAACRVPAERGVVLVVNGFDRVSGPAAMLTDSLAGFFSRGDSGVAYLRDISYIGDQRVFDLSLARVEDDNRALGASHSDFESEIIGGNTFDYPYLHGRSIAAAGYSFCSSSVRAVERGEVAMDKYRAVDLILGKQRTTPIGRGVAADEFRTFTPELQGAIRRLLASGGAIFVSGSYIASDLFDDATGTASAADRAFAEEVLHYTLDGAAKTAKLATSATTAAPNGRVRVIASRGGFSAGQYRFRTESTPDDYCVEEPDALKAVGANAFGVMRYIANNRTAAVACDAGGRTFVMGFPFETIASDFERDRLMRNALTFLFR